MLGLQENIVIPSAAKDLRRDAKREPNQRRNLVLACGNPLRGDDGAGWKIAEALEREYDLECESLCDFREEYAGRRLRVVTALQLTPELALMVSEADTVVLVDCSVKIPPGAVTIIPVEAASGDRPSLTHHMELSSLLSLTNELYGRRSPCAYLLAVGGESFELSETLSEPVQRAIPEAVAALKQLLQSALKEALTV